MKIMKSIAVVLAIGLVTAVSMGSAQAKCKSVNGHIISQVVTEFSNGDLCPSLCAEGRYVGGIQGSFTFVARTATPADTLDMLLDPGVTFTTGEINIDTKKYGTLTLDDASAFSEDGLFGGVGTVVDVDGDNSGRIRVYGVFDEGCVDCDYRGEICTP